MQIEDGTGSGNRARVTNGKMLRVYAQVESEISHVSEQDGLAFSWSNVSYDYDAGDTILLLKNTSPTKSLIIDAIEVGGDAATIAIAHFPVCETPTGTAIVGVNLNRQSGKVAEAVAKGDESTNSLGDIHRNLYIVAAQSKAHPTKGAIVLGLNDCIAIDFVTNGAACYCSIEGYYHAIE